MDNDYNSLYSVQLQAVFIIDINGTSPFTITGIFEMQENGKFSKSFTKTWKYDNAIKNSRIGEESDRETIEKDEDKSSVRILVAYKNAFIKSGISRSTSNRLGNSTESPMTYNLLELHHLRSNGDEIGTLSDNSAVSNRNTRNWQRDEVIKNVSPKYGSDVVESGQNYGNRQNANGIVRNNLEFININKNSIIDNGDENICSRNLINLKSDTGVFSDNSHIFNFNSKYDNGSDSISSENINKCLTQNYGIDSFSSENNWEQEQDFSSVNRNKNNSHRNLGDNIGLSRGINGTFHCQLNARQNTACPQGNSDIFPNFDSVEFFSETNDMAYEKSGFESLAIFIMLLKRYAVIIEEYVESSTNSNKNLKCNGRTRFQLVVVPSDVFEDAMRQCRIVTVELTHSYIFPNDCRFFVGVPIYRNGYIHRKDQLQN